MPEPQGQHTNVGAEEVYTPLDRDRKSFRLLFILPGRNHEPLRCHLLPFDLSSDLTPVYETISYCWGDARITEAIIVNGSEVLVPSSCAAVLRRVRLPGAARTVWIDAICINQELVDERNHQVPLMRDVYKNGKRNLIYLGEGDLSRAFAAVRAILDDPASEDCLERIKDGVLMFQYKLVNLSIDLPALADLYSREWFWRVWTFQEGALSRESVCLGGPAEMPLLDLTKASCILMQHHLFLADTDILPNLEGCFSFASHLEGVLPNNISEGYVPCVSALLLALHRRRCTLSVDRIYGLLGFMPGQQSIVPDYNKTPIEAFQEAVKAVIADEKSLNILRHAIGVYDPADGEWNNAPSWIPAWAGTMEFEESLRERSLVWVRGKGAHNGVPYDQTLVNKTDDLRPNLLKVGGFELGVVSRIIPAPASSPRHDWPAQIASTVRQVRDLASESVRLQLEPPDGQQLAVVMTLSVGPGRLLDEDLSVPLILFQSFMEYVDSGLAGEIPMPGELRLNDASEGPGQHREAAEKLHQAYTFQNMFIAGTFLLKTCLLDTGYFGKGSHQMKEGDVVAVLYGLEYPALLRPTRDGRYRFVGLSWFYGVMDGEVVVEHKKMGGIDKIFELC